MKKVLFKSIFAIILFSIITLSTSNLLADYEDPVCKFQRGSTLCYGRLNETMGCCYSQYYPGQPNVCYPGECW